MGLLEYIEDLKKQLKVETDPKKKEYIEYELDNAYDFCREHYGQ